MRVSRRLVTWAAVPVIVAQLGCAARDVRVPPAPSPGTVSEADLRACDEFAKKQKTKSVVGLDVLGVLLVPVSVGLAGVALATLQPQGVEILRAPAAVLEAASKNAKANQVTRAAARRECLEPLRLRQAMEPDHPALVPSLTTLARAYAASGGETQAEALYQRALAIQEKTLGPEHPDVATTLDGYAAVLCRANREAEAIRAVQRAHAIRATAAPGRRGEPVSFTLPASGCDSAAATPEKPMTPPEPVKPPEWNPGGSPGATWGWADRNATWH